jgi:hypothetical protein
MRPQAPGGVSVCGSQREKMHTGSLTRSLSLSAIELELSAGAALPRSEIFAQAARHAPALLPGSAAYRRSLRVGLWVCAGVIVLASCLCISIWGIALVAVLLTLG